MLDVILLFHKDLSNYSDHDIRLMAKNAELPHDSVYNYRWLLAILHAQDKKAGMYPYPALESMVKNWKYMDLWNYANTSRDTLSQVIRDYPGLRKELGKDLEVPHYPFKDFFYFAFLKPEPSQKPLVDLIVRDIKEVLLDDDVDRNFIRMVAYLTGHGEEMEEEDILTTIDETIAYTAEASQEIIDAIKYLLKDGLIPKNVAMRLAFSDDFAYFLLMLYYKYITEADFIDIIKHYAREEELQGNASTILDYIMCHSNITKDQLQELLPLFKNDYNMRINYIIDYYRPDGNIALENICRTYKKDSNVLLYHLPVKHFIPEKDKNKVLYSWCV